jgi:hypothetical protein
MHVWLITVLMYYEQMSLALLAVYNKGYKT